MKIAILGIKTYPAFFGADRVVENLLKYFKTDNEYYLYLTTVDNKIRLNCFNNIHFIYIPTFKNKYLKAPIFFIISALHALIKGKYDFVHIHNSDFGIFGLILKCRYKILGTLHGSAYLRDKWNRFAKLFLRLSEKIFFKYSNIITTVSLPQYKQISNCLNKRVYYIPNGVNFDENVSGFVDLSSFNLSAGNFYLFCAGRIDRTKGLHTLIKAFMNIRTNKNLFVIGDFNHDKEYSNEIFNEVNHTKNIIIYKGLFNKEDLYFILKKSFAFVFPSEVEAMSMMLLEAISLKVPVVCSDIPENISVVGEQYPYKFRNKDIYQLRLILEDLEVKGINNDVVENLYQKVLREFNWEFIAREYEKLYKELIET